MSRNSCSKKRVPQRLFKNRLCPETPVQKPRAPQLLLNSVPKRLFKSSVPRNACSKIVCPATPVQTQRVPQLLFKNRVSGNSCSKTVCPETPAQKRCPKTPAQNHGPQGRVCFQPASQGPDTLTPLLFFSQPASQRHPSPFGLESQP